MSPARRCEPHGAGPDGQLRQGGRALLLAFYTALRSLKLYPVENATVQKALDDLDAAGARAPARSRASSRSAWRATSSSSTPPGSGSSSTTTPPSATSWRCSAPSTSARSGSSPASNRREWQIFLSLLLSLSERGQPRGALRGAPASAWTRGRSGPRARARHCRAGDPERGAGARRPPSGSTAQGVAVTKDVITGIRLGRATSVKRVKRAVQLIVDQVLNNETSMVGLTTHPRLRRVHLHPLGERLHLLRGAGQEAGLSQDAALRSRHDGAAPRRGQGARAARPS